MTVPISLTPPAGVQLGQQKNMQFLLLILFGLAVVGGIGMTIQSFGGSKKPAGDAKVTADKVKKLVIDKCIGSSPCKHACTIKLDNGKEKKQELDGPALYALKGALRHDQIESKLRGNHFDYCSSLQRKNADTILTELFKA